MRNKKVTFRVSFELPEFADAEDAQTYVTDAVEGWAGSLCPGTHESQFLDADPMFDLNRETIQVIPCRNKKFHMKQKSSVPS